MKDTDIYQTLENRNNDEEVETHGPYFCSAYADGKLKRGIREPWLGEGYYFWDTRISDAHWWGDTVYKQRGYIICRTSYDQHSPLLCDLVGDMKLLDDFFACAVEIMKENREEISKHSKKETISFAAVLAYLRKLEPFKHYKAIRVRPHSNANEKSFIRFPKDKIVLSKSEKIQICFFDKTLLTNPFKVIDRGNAFVANQTI